MNPLAAAFASGRFVLTAELECPKHAGAANVARQARAFAGLVDAVNCTDNSAAVVRMSPIAAAAIAAHCGVTPVVQLTCRDRNRIALQSDVLGAAAVGAAGIVCMRGDPPEVGNHPDAAPVYDLDTPAFLRAVCGLRAGRFISGDPVRFAPDVIPGAVVTPADNESSVKNLRVKADAGAEFVQTQIGFDTDEFAAWMRRVRAAGLHERVRILAGVAPIKRLAVARFLRDEVPGVTVPDEVFRRLEAADDVETEGVRIAAERLRDVRGIPGVAGAHIMTFGWFDGVRHILTAAGVGR
jgi:methylenetetrahydrofolate reductase (NADPH)